MFTNTCKVDLCLLDEPIVMFKIVHVQEAELRVDVLQHHAALIGGPNATSCPICHKLFLGSEALMEHMKNIHKDTNASGVPSKWTSLISYWWGTGVQNG